MVTKRYSVKNREEMLQIAENYMSYGYKKITDLFYVLMLEARHKRVVIEL